MNATPDSWAKAAETVSGWPVVPGVEKAADLMPEPQDEAA